MSASCSGCGDCCERIPLQADTARRIRDLVAWYDRWLDWALAHPLDGEDGGLEDTRNIEDATFITAHWRSVSIAGLPGVEYFTCDAFDPIRRACTVHGTTQPPICRGFPWYKEDPDAIRLLPFARCAFWADVVAREPDWSSYALSPSLRRSLPVLT